MRCTRDGLAWLTWLKHFVPTCLTFGLLGCPLPAHAQEVAITVDDLPSHGPLPPGTTRVDVTREMLAAFKAANVPVEVPGFERDAAFGMVDDILP